MYSSAMAPPSASSFGASGVGAGQALPPPRWARTQSCNSRSPPQQQVHGRAAFCEGKRGARAGRRQRHTTHGAPPVGTDPLVRPLPAPLTSPLTSPPPPTPPPTPPAHTPPRRPVLRPGRRRLGFVVDRGRRVGGATEQRQARARGRPRGRPPRRDGRRSGHGLCQLLWRTCIRG